MFPLEFRDMSRQFRCITRHFPFRLLPDFRAPHCTVTQPVRGWLMFFYWDYLKRGYLLTLIASEVVLQSTRRTLTYVWLSLSKGNTWHFYELFAPHYSHCMWLSKNINFRVEDAFKLKVWDLEKTCLLQKQNSGLNHRKVNNVFQSLELSKASAK
jgi:hypothetical protein